MIEENMEITLDNDKKFTVLRVMVYNNKKYALISDLKKENYVVNVESDEDGESISLISNAKEEELIVSKFLNDTLKELKNYGIE